MSSTVVLGRWSQLLEGRASPEARTRWAGVILLRETYQRVAANLWLLSGCWCTTFSDLRLQTFLLLPCLFQAPGVTQKARKTLDEALVVGQQYRAGRPSRCGRGRGLPQHRRLLEARVDGLMTHTSQQT